MAGTSQDDRKLCKLAREMLELWQALKKKRTLFERTCRKLYDELHPVVRHTFASSAASEEDAEDCTQSFFMRLLPGQSSLLSGFDFTKGNDRKLRSWLRKVLRNQVIDCMRKKRGRPRTPEPVARLGLGKLGDEIFLRLVWKGGSFDEVLRRLAERFEELSVAEIEQAMVKVETLAWRHRSRRPDVALPDLDRHEAEGSCGQRPDTAMEHADAKKVVETICRVVGETVRSSLSGAGSLTPREAELIVKFVLERRSMKQIAVEMGLEPGSAVFKKQTKELYRIKDRARRSLARVLEGEGITAGVVGEALDALPAQVVSDMVEEAFGLLVGSLAGEGEKGRNLPDESVLRGEDAGEEDSE